ncbi:hypothetical protein TNIN_324901 [Trichonephila inaurata madagascariensis]|uniref:Uncharacterized protein n=1 Tax=Trichonephila inaurata madagascariensis TaxID=2747483 RepID=A0A8X7C662_9ARAC|nr:hypothetical protein TNIN_324901 [Trichonephila inaurata madagascariensis]
MVNLIRLHGLNHITFQRHVKKYRHRIERFAILYSSKMEDIRKFHYLTSLRTELLNSQLLLQNDLFAHKYCAACYSFSSNMFVAD